MNNTTFIVAPGPIVNPSSVVFPVREKLTFDVFVQAFKTIEFALPPCNILGCSFCCRLRYENKKLVLSLGTENHQRGPVLDEVKVRLTVTYDFYLFDRQTQEFSKDPDYTSVFTRNEDPSGIRY